MTTIAVAVLGLAAFSTPDTLFASYSDGTFSDEVWDFTYFESPDQYVSSNSVQVTTGGNPGYYRSNSVIIVAPKTTIAGGAIAAFNSNAVYTPPADVSRFHHVKYRHDKLGDMLWGAVLLIEQAGVYYRGPSVPAPSNATIWETIYNADNDEIEADEFVEVDDTTFGDVPMSTLHPNFDSSDPITFGYLCRGWKLQSGAMVSGSIGVDNWLVEIWGY